MKNFLKRLASAFTGERPAPAEESPSAAPSVSATPPAGQNFQPQTELERMLVIASGQPDQRPAFERMLREGDLLAATPEAPENDGAWRTLEAGENVSLYNVTAPDGATVAALFTSEARVAEAFGAGTGFIRVKGQTLLEMVSGQGAFLNPGSAYGVHWTANDLAVLLGNPVARTIEKDTQVLLASPAEPPEALIADLRARLGAEPRVAAAWLALAQWPESSTSSWYLDVRTDLPHEAVHGLLSGLFTETDMRGLPLDMVINAPGSEGIGIRVAPAGLN